MGLKCVVERLLTDGNLEEKISQNPTAEIKTTDAAYKLGKLTFYRGHSIYQYYNDSLPTP